MGRLSGKWTWIDWPRPSAPQPTMRNQHSASVVNALRIVLASVALLVLGAPAQPMSTPPKGVLPDLKKIHALLVIDTDSSLKESVGHDRLNIEMILKAFIPEKMREITVLEGKKVTRQAILDYYQRLRTGPEETVLFFYAGHGKLDEKNRHCFELQEGNDLIRREDVLQAMKARNPGLAVLLSDCCSVRTRPTTRAGDDRLVYETGPNSGLNPVLRNLLFQHRGVVDITAAQDGTGSWGDDKHGGIFTQSLCGLLRDQIKAFDKDRFVSWKEFFPLLERRTEETFEKWCEQMRTIEKMDVKKQQRTQKPRAFSPLPEAPNAPNVLAKTDPKIDKKAFAVVSLINKTGKTLTYNYRWNKEEKWRDGKLETNGKVTLHQIVKADLAETQMPRLEVFIPSEKARDDLQPRKWIGTGRPAFKDGREIELNSNK